MESKDSKQSSFLGLGVSLVQLIVIVLLIICAYLIGSLKTKVEFLEKGNTAAAAPSAQPAAAQPQAAAQPTVNLDEVKNAFKQSQIKFADTNKKAVIVEVADPSCPFCQVAAGKNGTLNTQVGDRFKLVADGGTYIAPVPEIKKLIDQGKVAYSYIYYPGHGNGEMGTKAMYCAFEKGKFWEVHDLLMSSAGYDLLNNTVKNDKTKAGDLAKFLAPAMDEGQLQSCLTSGKYDDRINEDVKLAQKLGISGTPGFYVNETNFAGAYSYKDMEPAITAALK